MNIEPLDYIWISLVMTFCTLSVYSLTREGQLFEFVRNIFKGIIYAILEQFATCQNVLAIRKIEKYINKPFFECPPCMASVWGSLFYWSIFGQDIKTWVVCVLISSILNKIIYGYVE